MWGAVTFRILENPRYKEVFHLLIRPFHRPSWDSLIKNLGARQKTCEHYLSVWALRVGLGLRVEQPSLEAPFMVFHDLHAYKQVISCHFRTGVKSAHIVEPFLTHSKIYLLLERKWESSHSLVLALTLGKFTCQ